MYLNLNIISTRSLLVTVLTAAGLVPSGIMYLTMTSLGSYGQCLSTRAYEENDNTSSPLLFMGQYCGLNVMPSREAYDTLLEYVDKLGDIQVSLNADTLKIDKQRLKKDKCLTYVGLAILVQVRVTVLFLTDPESIQSGFHVCIRQP